MPDVHAGDDGDGPLLPLPIPVQRNRHSPEPRTQHRAHQAAEGLVQRGVRAGQGQQSLPVDAPRVEYGEQGDKGEVRGREEGVLDVVEERGAEEDEGDVDARGGDGCEDEGEDRCLEIAAPRGQ